MFLSVSFDVTLALKQIRIAKTILIKLTVNSKYLDKWCMSWKFFWSKLIKTVVPQWLWSFVSAIIHHQQVMIITCDNCICWLWNSFDGWMNECNDANYVRKLACLPRRDTYEMVGKLRNRIPEHFLSMVI